MRSETLVKHMVAIAAVLVAGFCEQAVAQDLTWQVFGALGQGRHHHKIQPIGEGKILVVGGYTKSTGILSGVPTASCEIIDLRSGQIRDAAMLNVARGVMNLVTADDGTIYVLGGDTGNGETRLVERYDVANDKWEIVGRLQKQRWQHASAFISRNEILVAGGFNEESAEIFNVETGSSALVANFPMGANSMVAVCVPGVPPAFIGGRESGPNSPSLTTAFTYDRTTNRWMGVGSFPERAIRPTVLPLADGTVAVIGGSKTETPFVGGTGVHIVSSPFTIRQFGTLSVGRQWHGVGQLSDGRILVAGGFTEGPDVTNKTELIDLSAGTIKPGPAMNEPHAYLEMVTMQDRGIAYTVAVSGLKTLSSSTSLVEVITEGCLTGTKPMQSQQVDTVGAATVSPAGVQLTPSEPFSRGAIWSRQKVDLRGQFSMLVGFRMANGDDRGEKEDVPSVPGADGIAIVLQNEGPNAIGQYGRGIGYDGITKSLAIEFDTYQNEPMNDPNGNHIGIQSMGRRANSARHAPPANLAFASNVVPMRADGQVYYAYVEYADGRLRVYFNDRPSFRAPVLTRDIDIDSLIGLDSLGRAWVGITSATGQSIEQHEIVRWEINGCDRDVLVSVTDESSAETSSDILFRMQGNRLVRSVAEPTTITVFDCQGRLVHLDVTNALEIDLGAKGLSSGCYLIRASTEDRVHAMPWMLVH